MKKTVIVDMDGTIADCEHRRHHVDTGNWPAFFEGMHEDGVFEHTREVVFALHAAGYAIVIVTARPDENDYRAKSVDWLNRHGFTYDAIYMRKGGDYRKDNIVKKEILMDLLNDGYEPAMALDDRNQVVAMWREMGIPCMQVNEGDFDNRQSRYVRDNQGKEMLHMMIGPSGAGKSTLIKQRYRHEDVVSSDQVRRDLFGSHDAAHVHNPDNLALTWAYTHKLVQARMECGLFTVLDSTGLRRKDRLSVLELVPHGYLVRYVVVDRDYDEKIKDRDWRPVALIDKHHQAMKSALKDVMKADGFGHIVVEDTRKKR